MERLAYDNLKIIWEYMHMNMELCNVDCIIGFGNYNDDIALRAAELYKKGYSSKILFTGGLGRMIFGPEVKQNDLLISR